MAGIELPATQVLGPLLRSVPEAPLPIEAPADHRTFREIVYTEEGQVGYLSFDFYNGAMGTSQCYRLRDAFLHARSRPIRVIVLLGGSDFWSNGIHLNAIEASVDPAEEFWRNINAINDLIAEILDTMSHLVIAGFARRRPAAPTRPARKQRLPFPTGRGTREHPPERLMPLLPARSASCRWRAEDGLQWPVRHQMWAVPESTRDKPSPGYHSKMVAWCWQKSCESKRMLFNLRQTPSSATWIQ